MKYIRLTPCKECPFRKKSCPGILSLIFALLGMVEKQPLNILIAIGFLALCELAAINIKLDRKNKK